MKNQYSDIVIMISSLCDIWPVFIKVEGRLPDDWHGHVTALSIAGDYRRLHLAAELMNRLEEVSENKKALFVDLFVRKSNQVAVKMYEKLGYVIYRYCTILLLLFFDLHHKVCLCAHECIVINVVCNKEFSREGFCNLMQL